VCKLVCLNCLYSDKAIASCRPSLKCAPASVNTTRSHAVAKILPHNTFGGHVIGHTSRDHLIPHTVCHFLLVVLWINQASVSNGFHDIQRRMLRNGWYNLDTTSKQRSRSFILVPIDLSYRPYDFLYRLSIVTFARTHRLATIHSVQTDYRRMQHCSISAIALRTVG